VLQLLGEHPMSRVTQAIEACLREHIPGAESVIQRTRSLATKREATAACDELAATRVHVPLPDLNRFDQLLCRPVASPITVLFA